MMKAKKQAYVQKQTLYNPIQNRSDRRPGRPNIIASQCLENKKGDDFRYEIDQTIKYHTGILNSLKNASFNLL